MKLATKLVFVAIASVVLLTSCGGGRVVVAQQPTPAPAAFAPAPAPAPSSVVVTVPTTPAPPVVSTVIEPSPGPDYIRVEGYYNWLGDRYVWVPATWARIPRAGATFVPGHWQSTAGGYVWMQGYWQ